MAINTKKYLQMKKNKWILSLTLIASILASCGYDDELVVFEYTIVKFPNQNYVRNVIVGEGLEMNVGVSFSGVLKNTMQREVDYVIDTSLIPDGKTILPADYYSAGNATTIVIPKGSLEGYLNVKLDSAKFVDDPKSLTGEYVIPIKLVSCNNIDSINEAMNYMVISLSYFAKQQANYNYTGTVIKSKDGIDTEITYQNDPTHNESIRLLKTVGSTSMQLVADQIGNNDPAKGTYSFLIDVPINGGNVTITSDPASTVVVTTVGESNYNADKRTFTLSYTYTLNDGTVCNATETMTFRNRIRDLQENGVYINDWR
jgi:hypothetical protein